ncbi:Fur family transcriptional regulator, partial [Spirochaetota bacterium]
MESLQISDILSEKGVKPSLHRIKIYEYLAAKKNHPTADMIYKDISGDIPTLSKTTIYNTLRTFYDNDIVQAITIEENEVRFDADMMHHAHFKCSKCGSIYDVEIDNPIFSAKSI